MPISITNVTGTFKPLHAGVLVRQMKFDQITTSGGIIIPGDDGELRGIHPRWAEVIAIGPEQTDVVIGQWVLVAHGRWSRGFTLNGETCRTVDPKDILGVSDEKPVEDFAPPTMGHTRDEH